MRGGADFYDILLRDPSTTHPTVYLDTDTMLRVAMKVGSNAGGVEIDRTNFALLT